MINAIRAHLAEFGIIAPIGRKGVEELLRVIADPSDQRVPDVVRACLAALGSQLLSFKKQILDFDRTIVAWHRSNQTTKRLNCIPGVGPLLATRLSRASPILKPSDQAATSRPGSGCYPNSTRAGGAQARQYQQTGGPLSGQCMECSPLAGRNSERRSVPFVLTGERPYEPNLLPNVAGPFRAQRASPKNHQNLRRHCRRSKGPVSVDQRAQ